MHIHKAGGTSMKFALDPFLAWNDVILGGVPRGEAINLAYRARFGLGKHGSVGDIERVCGRELIDSYFVFALVRNPIHRICSYYNFIGGILARWSEKHGTPISQIPSFLAHDPEATRHSPELGWPGARAFWTSDGFSQFIRQESLLEDRALQSQLSRLRNSEGAPIGFTLRVEEPDRWLPGLRSRLGADLDFQRHNRSQAKLVDPLLLSAPDTALLREIYAEDFEALGYE